MASTISSLYAGRRVLAAAALASAIFLAACGSGEPAQTANPQQMQTSAVPVETIFAGAGFG